MRVVLTIMSLPTKEGSLYKHKSFPKKWAYRYFKLNKTYLHCFETQHSLNPKDSIVRTNISAVETSNAFPDKVYAFTVFSKSDKWHLAAADETERKEWMEVLTAHLPPGSSVDTSQPEKQPLTRGEDDPPSPTESVPQMPGYMVSHMQQPTSSAPPCYDDACSSKQKYSYGEKS